MSSDEASGHRHDSSWVEVSAATNTHEVIAWFEAERQALATMDHPNIAKVLDAGMTLGAPASRRPVREGEEKLEQRAGETPALPAGRPFFVIELVRRTRITDYCDQAGLSTKERLDLFIKDCHGVPSSTLIRRGSSIATSSRRTFSSRSRIPPMPGVPKVIDFGIAKATVAKEKSEFRRKALTPVGVLFRTSPDFPL